jgi:hypothetical protein
MDWNGGWQGNWDGDENSADGPNYIYAALIVLSSSTAVFGAEILNVTRVSVPAGKVLYPKFRQAPRQEFDDEEDEALILCRAL